MITVETERVVRKLTHLWHSDNTAYFDADVIWCECILWANLWAMLDCLLALDTSDTSKLWRNLYHFCRNAIVHWIPILLCAVTPLLLVAHCAAHHCEKINSKTRQGVSTFVQKLNQELAVLRIIFCKQDSLRIFNPFALFESLQKREKAVKKQQLILAASNNFHQHMCCLPGKSLLHVNPSSFSHVQQFFSLFNLWKLWKAEQS